MKTSNINLALLLSLLISSTFIFQSCKDKPIKTSKVEQENTKEEVTSTNESKSKKKLIMFYGNSLTAGYGLSEGEDFPSIIRMMIDSFELNYEVVNAGLSGETSSAGLERIDWVLQRDVDIFMLELGANDMLRGQDFEATEVNLRKILEKVRNKNPETKLILAGMQAAPNMGPNYVNGFNAIFPKLAKEFKATLIPFFLEGVAGVEDLNQGDRKHPNVEGTKVVAGNVWHYLEPLL